MPTPQHISTSRLCDVTTMQETHRPERVTGAAKQKLVTISNEDL
jgi:hypothetical protein